MEPYKDKLAQTTLLNVYEIEEVEKTEKAATKAEKLLPLKKKVKSSYRPWSFVNKLKTLAADALIAVTFVPMTVPLAILDVVADIFYLPYTQKDIERAMGSTFNLRKKFISAKKEKNKDRDAMLAKCDGVMAGFYDQHPNVLFAAMQSSQKKRGDLSAVFRTDAGKRQAIDDVFKERKQRALRRYNHGY